MWVSIISWAYFFTMMKAGKFRLDKNVEIIGLDIAELGGVGEDIYNKIKVEFGHAFTNSLRTSKNINGTDIENISADLLASP